MSWTVCNKNKLIRNMRVIEIGTDGQRGVREYEEFQEYIIISHKRK